MSPCASLIVNLLPLILTDNTLTQQMEILSQGWHYEYARQGLCVSKIKRRCWMVIQSMKLWNCIIYWYTTQERKKRNKRQTKCLTVRLQHVTSTLSLSPSPVPPTWPNDVPHSVGKWTEEPLPKLLVGHIKTYLVIVSTNCIASSWVVFQFNNCNRNVCNNYTAAY